MYAEIRFYNFLTLFLQPTTNVGTNTNSVGPSEQFINGGVNGVGPITKHSMISYQTSDGSINNRLPPMNGEYRGHRSEFSGQLGIVLSFVSVHTSQYLLYLTLVLNSNYTTATRYGK